MAELITFDNIGAGGLNTDIAAHSLANEQFNDGFNFRVYAKKVITAGGRKYHTTVPTDFDPGWQAGNLVRVETAFGGFWVAMGNPNVYAYDNRDWARIHSSTDSFPVGGEQHWTHCMLGQIAIFNNPNTGPMYWSRVGLSQQLVDLPWNAEFSWQQSNISCEVMRSHKTFIFALNLTDQGVEKPDTFRWSTAADINGLPYTWDESDLAAIAGESSLGGDGGPIIDAHSLRDDFYIYSEKSIDKLTLVGGEFTWKRQEMSNTIGLLSKNTIAEIEGAHYFMGDGDIYINNGHQIKSIMVDRVRTRFTTSITPEHYNNSFVVSNHTYKELWFCVPTDGAEDPNMAFVYSWESGAWAIRDIPDDTRFAAYGPLVQADDTLKWNDWQGTWTEQIGVWGNKTLTPLAGTVVCIDKYGRLYDLDSIDGKDSEFAASYLERTDMVVGDHRQVTTITRVYPYMVGTTPVNIQIGSQDYAGSPVRWKPAIKFTPSTDRKIDVRSTGELHCWRVEAIDTGNNVGTGNWNLSGMAMEVELDGVR